MNQPFSTSFTSLVAIIVVRLPDADLWLPFDSPWRKSMMRVFSLMGVVCYSVPSLMVAWISLQFGLLSSIFPS